MNAMLTRRAALLAGAGLFVALAAPAVAQTNAGKPPETGVDGMLAIGPDGRCTVLTTKTEFGQDILAALAQIAAEELDLPYAMVDVPHPDTAISPDHGLTGGSLTIQIIGPRLRRAAATARAALLRMGADRLGAPVAALETEDGFVRVAADPSRRVAYAALIGGRRFDLAVDASVLVKDPARWRVAGRDAPRPDLLAKVTATAGYLHDLRLPGMLHARVLHAPRVGAELVSVELPRAPARLVRVGGLAAVVAEQEWHVVRAARDVAATWSAGTPIPAMDAIFAAARATPVAREEFTVNRGDPASVLASAASSIAADYAFGVQTHGTIGPSCAVATFAEGQLTVHSGSQAPFDLQLQLSELLGLSRTSIRVIYHPSAGCFGRNGLEDAASEAAVLALELSPRPVRVQWMRHDEMGSEPKGPPMAMTCRGAVGADGRIAAWDSALWVPNHVRNVVRTTAAAMLGRSDGTPLGAGNVHGNSNPPYDGIPAARTVAHRLAETPFRPSWIRTPGRMQNCFAVESFMDELAAAAGRDPVAFRLDHLSEPRGRAVIEAAARAANWQPRPSSASRGADGLRRGRGIAYVRYDNVRTHVACVMDVEVDMRAGRLRVTDCLVAHDCGQVINPDGVRLQVEGCVLQTLSRTLSEEITWQGNAITSLDWASYPILAFPDAPRIETVLLDRPNDPPWAAGEPTAAVVPGAVGNAVFDATGIRLRHAPFTPERLKLAATQAR